MIKLINVFVFVVAMGLMTYGLALEETDPQSTAKKNTMIGIGAFGLVVAVMLAVWSYKRVTSLAHPH